MHLFHWILLGTAVSAAALVGATHIAPKVTSSTIGQWGIAVGTGTLALVVVSRFV